MNMTKARCIASANFTSIIKNNARLVVPDIAKFKAIMNILLETTDVYYICIENKQIPLAIERFKIIADIMKICNIYI